MKIFLTHGYFLNADEKELAIMKPYVPLGILYISAYLKQNGYTEKNGHSVTVFDSTFSSPDEQRNKILELKPEIVAIYCNLMTKLNVLPLIKFIRSQPELAQTKIILGGPEPPFHAAEFLNYGADVIVEGEGETAMKELAEEFAKPNPGLHNIAGIFFLNNGEVINTPQRKIRIKMDSRCLNGSQWSWDLDKFWRTRDICSHQLCDTAGGE